LIKTVLLTAIIFISFCKNSMSQELCSKGLIGQWRGNYSYVNEANGGSSAIMNIFEPQGGYAKLVLHQEIEV